VHSSGKWNLVRVKILPTRLALDLVREIPKNILDGIGNILDASVQGEVCTLISIILQTSATYDVP
jgi:hypothetical protein